MKISQCFSFVPMVIPQTLTVSIVDVFGFFTFFFSNLNNQCKFLDLYMDQYGIERDGLLYRPAMGHPTSFIR